MLNGICHSPVKYFFGRGMECEVGRLVREHTDLVLLHYGGRSLLDSPLYGVIRDSLCNAGVGICELGGVQPNPRAELVRRGIELCRQKSIGFILAVGGGSVIDSAKAISIGAKYDGDFLDFFWQKTVPTEALRIGVVVTIPGSGSESSLGSVITDTASRRKLVCDNPLLAPVFAILNPEYTFTLSPFQSSCGIVDAMSHLMERYFSNTPNVECSDRICEGLLRVLMDHATRVADAPADYDIRAEIMWACRVAQDPLPGFGRKQDWACHKIAHEISGLYDFPHGAVIGVLFLAWMKVVSPRNVGKIVQFGVRVFGLDDRMSPENVAQQTIAGFERFLVNIGLPIRLRELGRVEKENFSTIAKNSIQFMRSGTIGNYVRIDCPGILELLKKAY